MERISFISDLFLITGVQNFGRSARFVQESSMPVKFIAIRFSLYGTVI